MKRSKLTTFTVIVLLITMIALIMVSSTYAKYTTELSGSDSVVVAKFDVDGTETFDLFDTILDTYDDEEEEDVAEGKIAPGTCGSFTITLENNSEVSVGYALSFTASNSDVPIEYSVDGGEYVTADNLTSQATGTMLYGEATTKDVTIAWRWAFEGANSTNYTTSQTDLKDTALGEAASPAEVEVTASVVFTQIDSSN